LSNVITTTTIHHPPLFYRICWGWEWEWEWKWKWFYRKSGIEEEEEEVFTDIVSTDSVKSRKTTTRSKTLFLLGLELVQ